MGFPHGADGRFRSGGCDFKELECKNRGQGAARAGERAREGMHSRETLAGLRMASAVRSGNLVSTNARVADVGKWRTRKQKEMLLRRFCCHNCQIGFVALLELLFGNSTSIPKIYAFLPMH